MFNAIVAHEVIRTKNRKVCDVEKSHDVDLKNLNKNFVFMSLYLPKKIITIWNMFVIK